VKPKILPLLFIVMLLVSPFTLTAFADDEVGDETPEGEPVDPETLEKLRLLTQERLQQLLGIFGDNDLPPGVMENFMHAKQAMEEAGEKSNSQAAAQMYNRAMMHFRNALRQYLHEYPDTVIDAGDPGGDTPPAPGDEPPEDLGQQISDAKMQLILRFQERFQERMTLMYQALDDVVGNLSPQDAQKAQNTIQKAEQKLLRIQERIELGQFDEALDELDDATEELDEDLDSLDDDQAAQMFRTMNKLQAKVQKMEEKHQGKGQLEDDINDLKMNFNSNRDKDKDKGVNGQGSDNGNNGNNPDEPDNPDKPDNPDNPGKGGE